MKTGPSNCGRSFYVYVRTSARRQMTALDLASISVAHVFSLIATRHHAIIRHCFASLEPLLYHDDDRTVPQRLISILAAESKCLACVHR